ncbi:hypothetical protein EXN66_Car013907 [Channa argus]|uniref:Uncharacterized protein n=1 Tax=Channa argus TaxID=215402 RepID=A0A6G1Q7U0_CHAAH|nr:hypothetical protein EXN66_Car013907 [Channa argus]
MKLKIKRKVFMQKVPNVSSSVSIALTVLLLSRTHEDCRSCPDRRPEGRLRGREREVAGSGVGLQELTAESIHCRIFTQSVGAGGDVGLWVVEAVTGGEGRLLQEITAVPQM